MMPENLASLRTYLRGQIGLGTDARGLERANAIINEGLNSIDELVDLADDDGIKTLCQNVRKPSGTIPQPNWTAPDPNPQGLQAP